MNDYRPYAVIVKMFGCDAIRAEVPKEYTDTHGYNALAAEKFILRSWAWDAIESATVCDMTGPCRRIK